MTEKIASKKKRICVTIDEQVLLEASTLCKHTGRKLSPWIQSLLERELKEGV